jgi:hypothetical protein
MTNHRLSIKWRSGSKKNQFLTSLVTISVRKTSIGIGVCQGTLMSTKRNLISLGCGDSSIVPDCSPAAGGGIIVKRFFFAAGKQHDALNKKTMDKM